MVIAHPQLERRGAPTPIAWGELRFSEHRDASTGEIYQNVTVHGLDGVAQLRISDQEWDQLNTVGLAEEI